MELSTGKKITLYCISGLGGDERAFSFLDLAKDIEVRYLNWIIPDKDETMETYADKMLARIEQNENFGIIGLSFGGMVATEIAKKVKPAVLILLSSAMTRTELPKFYRFGGKTGLYKLVRPMFIKKGYFIFNWLRNSRNQAKRVLLGKMINDNDNRFLGWAIKTASNWENQTSVECVRIHGTKDKILPKGKLIAHETIKGGHLIVMSHPEEVSDFINRTVQDRLNS